TGRAAKDKFIVKEPTSDEFVWWGKVNKPLSEKNWEILYRRAMAYLQGRRVYVQDCWAGADPQYRRPVRIITMFAWQNLFARNMFIQAKPEELEKHQPEFTVVAVPGFHALPEIDGTNSETAVIVHFGKKLVVIAGTAYAGEIKKSIFTILNYLLPEERVLSMHCSANIGEKGDVALFFGLSGTGKTTLSADTKRRLIGDDEHGWCDRGVFNFEGGCYAKMIRLSKESEPQIYECTRKFGSVLENVMIDPDTRRVDLNDDTLTENTRGAYPISHIPSALREGVGVHPKNIFLLTCDAFGIMPPLAKLTTEQAMYHFLSGYTAKVAGTELGGSDEPTATFSACFGAPFMARHPSVYAKLLGEYVTKYGAQCWLLNTGWTNGPVGVGHRMKIEHSRALISAVLEGKLDKAPMEPDPVFGVLVPKTVEGVPEKVMTPRETWSDAKAYDAKAKELAGRFVKNYEEVSEGMPAEVRKAGPRG
ncbi:MAG: phosphoenolpyruvate carboxykinase (ATP), partial [Planctomycetota bacterium]